MIIGERIRIGTPKVRRAIEGRDAEPIQRLARAQVDAGAEMLDLNVGPQRRTGPEVMTWVIDAVQTRVPKNAYDRVNRSLPPCLWQSDSAELSPLGLRF